MAGGIIGAETASLGVVVPAERTADKIGISIDADGAEAVEWIGGQAIQSRYPGINYFIKLYEQGGIGIGLRRRIEF